ncbi:hypothetical protein FBALC1_11402 [Flavobacteriales bacterium ALC-1]|nr:hypothetical protein FBALC1_11402 [Flavobacteriales bacterium ALC-1]
MVKKILFLFALCFSVFVINAQDLDKAWNALLDNNRDDAQAIMSKKNTNKNDIEAVLLKKIIESENGQLSFDIDFIKSMSKFKEFENYLFALWTEPYFFNDYFENGFNIDHVQIFENIDFSTISNSTLKSAIIYLNAIVNRYNKDWDGFYEKLNTINTISDWEYCGVFENLNMSGIDIPYPPEKEPDLGVLFDAQSNGMTQWYHNKHTFELYNFFSNHDEFGYGVNYAQTFIESDKDQTVVLKLGKSGLVKVWLNDALIIEKNEKYITELDAYSYKVNLKKGINRILIKIALNSETPYFIMRLENLQGQPLKGVKATLKKRNYKKSVNTENLLKEDVHFAEAYFKNRLDNAIGNEYINRLCLFKTYLRNGKIEEAHTVIEPWYNKATRSSFLKTQMIAYYDKIGDVSSVSKIKENLIRRDPDYFASLLYAYDDFEELMKLDMQEYKSKLQKLGNAVDVSYMTNLSQLLIHLRENDFTNLRKELDALITNESLPSTIHATFAEFFSEVFNDDDATITALEAFNKKFFNWEVQTYLSHYYSKQNRTEDALKVYTEQLEHLDQDNNYHYKIIGILHEKMQFEKSLPYIEKAIENFPNSHLFLKYKADAYLQLNKKAEAIELYKKSLVKNPSNKELRNKINDLSNWVNPLNAYEIDNFYTYADTYRNAIESNNYGLNTILSQTNILGYENGGGEYKSTFIYELTSQNGISIFKEYNLGLGGDYIIHKSEAIKPDGSIIPADKNGSVLVFDQLEINDIILINYSASYSSSGRFYKDHILRHNFKGYHPSVNHAYRFFNKNKNIPTLISGGDANYNVKKVGDYYVHEWVEENLDGIPIGEDYMPPFSDNVPRLHISTIESWNEIANWYSDLVRNQLRQDNTVKSEFKKLFPKGHKQLSEDERAKIIYYYIMDNFNYSHVNFRQSGYVPQKPSKTIKSKLGDCKDLSSLFLVFAQMADLESNLVLILTSDYGKNNLVRPSTDFNHCIAKVKIDDKYFYLELTDQNLPYKALPMSLRDATALDIPFKTSQKKTSDLYHLVSNNRDKALFSSEYKMFIKDSITTLDLTTKTNSHLASYYIKINKEEKDDLLKETLFKDISDRTSETIELDKVMGMNYNRDEGVISYRTILNIDIEINQIGDYYTFKAPKFLNPYNENIIELKTRNYSIDYKQYENADFYKEKIELKLTEAYKFVEIPKQETFKYKNHEFSIDYNLTKQNVLEVTIDSKVNSENISQEDYLEFKVYVKKVLDTKDTIIKYQKV